MAKITGPTLIRNGNVVVLSASAAQASVVDQANRLVEFAMAQSIAQSTFADFEKALLVHVFAIARAVISLFLAASEERVRDALSSRTSRDGRTFRRAPSQQRGLVTWFGLVRYERTYLREVVDVGEAARGFHPLDAELGLLADRFSPNVLSVAVRLATRVAFSEARELLGWFLPCVPSTEVIQGATLGYGRYTPGWFNQAPAPDKDGEVLVVQFDSKGVPTATDEELRRRRGKHCGRARSDLRGSRRSATHVHPLKLSTNSNKRCAKNCPAIVTLSSFIQVKSIDASRPGTCCCGKITSRGGP